MANRLEPLNLTSFVGGLNLRRNQFQLGEDESPDLLNVDIDPRGGFYTRRGWMRWSDVDIVDTDVIDWEPRNYFIHNSSQGAMRHFVVNEGAFYQIDETKTQAAGSTACTANPHGASFVAWGDFIYAARGMATASQRITSLGVATSMAAASWSPVDAPISNTMPSFEMIESHGGYIFGAVTVEAATNRYHRIRWSHPGIPDSWRQEDYLDIEVGGDRITGLQSYEDHLLIFKSNSIWALYGYDGDSWQLRQISSTVGAPCPTAINRSETAVYFYSATNQGGVYGYTGGKPVYLSEKLQTAFDEILVPENVFVSWAARRLWVTVPWVKGIGGVSDPSTTFVYDPEVGNGAWTMYRSGYGSLCVVLDSADDDQRYPMSPFWAADTAAIVAVESIDDAYDIIYEPGSLGTTPDEGYLVTEGDLEIAVTGDNSYGQEFDSYYRTRWLHAGWPDRKKSWRRPTFICREVPRDTDLIVETYRDYNETTVHRVRTLKVRAEGVAYWTDDGFDGGGGGFDWTEGGSADESGRGADWGAGFAGSKMVRGGSMGLAKAVQMRVRASPISTKQRWGIDGIVAKIVMRRFR